MNHTLQINHFLVVEGIVTRHRKALLLCRYFFHSHILVLRLIDMQRVTLLFDALNLGIRSHLYCLEGPSMRFKPIYSLCHPTFLICCKNMIRSPYTTNNSRSCSNPLLLSHELCWCHEEIRSRRCAIVLQELVSVIHTLFITRHKEYGMNSHYGNVHSAINCY